MTLAALVPGLAGVALFMLPAGARGRPDLPGNGADPSRIGFPVGARFDRFATAEPVHTCNNLGRDAAPLWRGSPPCREFAQGRTCGIFTLANIADLVGWSRLSDVRWIDSRLYSLCLAPRSCASAVGRNLHLRQSDHCRRIGMGAPWRTPDIADVGWLRAGCRFSNRGVAARSRISGSKKQVSAYVTGVFATVAFGSDTTRSLAVCERPLVAATVEKVRDLASFRLGPRVGGGWKLSGGGPEGRRLSAIAPPALLSVSQAGEAPTAGATRRPFSFRDKER